jgi:DNA/RNA-binding domain of Phe-tRNA-synthetase-like protein
MITVDPHPLLDARAFVSELPRALADLPSPDWLRASLSAEAEAPLRPDDAVRSAVRDLLRYGGFKPAGRGKPASEYLVGAAAKGALGTINAAVDACNAAALHSGLPVSVVDLDKVREPLRVRIATAGERYVFNTAGQDIDVAGLLCLSDAEGPCANPVKDAQRTKTGPETRRTLSIVWGSAALAGRADATVQWYRQMVERLGAATASRL